MYITHTTHTGLYALCVGGKNLKRLTGLSHCHTILGETIEERLIVFFKFVIPGEDGFVFNVTGARCHGIFQGNGNPMRLALCVFEIQSSFPEQDIIDHILVHGNLLVVPTGRQPD